MSILRKYAGIGALVDHANKLIQESGNHIRPPENLSKYFTMYHSAAAYSDVRKALLAIPLYDLWSYEMVVGVREMCEVVEAAMIALEKLAKWPNEPPDYHKLTFSHFVDLMNQSDGAHQKVRSAIEKLGGYEIAK
ncbi:hypothetical protein CPter291_3537 [Collimonas pratensis]|uniref:Uncharacterized protein n=2 Tax=Collimonas pratensis TaxID=279113 RepID=A0ABN4MJE3_9BURK|nr:hypothetical protein CPter291_3537 [Collimonas pratensis]